MVFHLDYLEPSSAPSTVAKDQPAANPTSPAPGDKTSILVVAVGHDYIYLRTSSPVARNNPTSPLVAGKFLRSDAARIFSKAIIQQSCNI